MQFSKNKEQWLNERKTELRGRIVGDAIAKAKHADVYYREALDKELDKFITSLEKDLKRVYSVIRVENAEAKRKPSIASVRIVLNAYKNAKLKILLSNSRRIIEKWLKLARNATDKSIKKTLFSMAGKELSIEYDTAYDEALKLIIQRNIQLITNATSQTLTNIENIVYNGMTTGRGWADLQGELYKQKSISRNRVKLIASDQTAKTNQALNQIGQQQAGIKYFEWWGVDDERERSLHLKLNGKIFKWGDSPERLPIIDSYGTRGYPGDAVNCLTGNAKVMFPYGCKKLFRRKYEGFIFRITTQSGIVLEATPNHPVFTEYGWLSVNTLKEGDNLIKAMFNTDLIGKSNNSKLEVSVEKLWNSFKQSESRCRGTTFDFHGDGIENYVYIKDVNSFLPKDSITPRNKSASKFIFPFSYMKGTSIFFPFKSCLNFANFSSCASSHSFIGSLCKFSALFARCLFHTVEHSLRLISNFLPVFTQYSSNNLTTHIQTLTDRQYTFSIDVLRNYLFRGNKNLVMGNFHLQYTPIVKIEKIPFNGWVYNFETPTGYYIANGIVNHNCRCSAKPVWVLDGYKAVWIGNNKGYKIIKEK